MVFTLVKFSYQQQTTNIKLLPYGIYAICAQVLFAMFLYLAEAILSGVTEGSFSSESDDEGCDEPVLSQGMVQVVFCVLKVGNLGLIYTTTLLGENEVLAPECH